MIIDSVTVCDFRSFGGIHEISLAPRVRYGAKRPIILFGGLNGSGKTTLLLAIKFSLYGRHALGLGTNKSAYERFIRSCIHTSPFALINPNSAYVALRFTYGKLGRKSTYQVRREWVVDGKSFRESLRLWEDDRELTSLTPDECQGFLNELVPIGVSELFFFDGEKIAELAEDETGGALGDAIRRLLGLDLVERLRNDLRVYALKYENKSGKNTRQEDFNILDQSFAALKKDIETEEGLLKLDRDDLLRLEVERDRRETQLTARGGDWGKSREEQKARAVELTATLRKRESELRHELNGSYTLSLALGTLNNCLKETSAAVLASLDRRALDTVSAFVTMFKNRAGPQLKGKPKEILESTLAEFYSSFDVVPQGLVDVSARELGSLEQIVEQSIPGAVVRVHGLGKEMAEYSDVLDQITLQIDRAPDAETLRNELASVAEINQQLSMLRSEISVRARDLKNLYLKAIETARLLRNAHERESENKQLEQPLDYATKARLLLREFGYINTQRKVARLEVEFAKAFRALSRKDDIVVQAKIDPEKFTVALIDREGRVISKDQLSAGEKQIYAIAMLEALARTSGRRLPVIIDTPLGRLDSKHRANLVEHYFPCASHQVVLLSTDTEVDEPFYQSLSPHVSHAFEIEFDEREKASSLKEGYFWRHPLREAV